MESGLPVDWYLEWFGGNPHAGFYMKMWDTEGNVIYNNTGESDSAGGYYPTGHSPRDWGDLPIGEGETVTIGAFQIGYYTNVVPEPATLSLLALGSLLAIKRRR